MDNMEEFLKSNGPWDQLIRLKNIQLNRIKENVNIKIGDSLFIEPFLVPHRYEY